MSKTAILAALATVTLAAKPAAACTGFGIGGDGPGAIGYVLAAGLIGGYGYGMGRFIYEDVTGGDDSFNYGVGELTFNGLFAAGFGAATVDAIGDGRTGTALTLGALTTLHTALAINGARTMATYGTHLELPDQLPLTAIAGTAYGINALYWTTGMAEKRGRSYGVTEIAINAPLAAGLGYLAVDRFSDSSGPGVGLLYGGMAALSGAFVVHGVKTVISPKRSQPLDLLGTDVMPTVVSDGRELAPGLGTAGTW